LRREVQSWEKLHKPKFHVAQSRRFLDFLFEKLQVAIPGSTEGFVPDSWIKPGMNHIR
jgi:hypothetical protein